MENIDLPHMHSAQAVSAEIRQELGDLEQFQRIAEIFKQLGDTTRVRLFWLLCHGEACVVNLSAMMDMSSPAISHHLRLLRSSGLLVSRRAGKEVYYHAADTEQSRLLHIMIEQALEFACPN